MGDKHRSKDEEAIVAIMREYVTAGLIEKDIKKVVSILAEDIMGFGIGEQGMVRSLEDVTSVISKGMKEDDKGQYELRYEDVATSVHGDSAALCANIIITRTCDGQVAESCMRQSLSFHKSEGQWKIHMLHASTDTITKETIHAYPLKYAENALAHLREELQSETFDLMNRSISGGVIGTYIEKETFPLYFINDGMLSYLGYTREEFNIKFRKDVIGIVHQDDLAKLKGIISVAIKTNKDFEARFRVVKKNGEAIWMVERVRKSRDEDGKDVLVGVFIDVTEMVYLQNRLEEQAQTLEFQTIELEAQTEELESQKSELISQTEELAAQKEALEAKTNSLAINEERFRIALEKTSNIIFDCDMISGNIMHSSTPKKTMDFVANIKDAKETLIIGGEIMNEYLDDFQKTFQAVQNGLHQAECIVKVKLATGKEIWNKISLTGIEDQEGRVIRAIGMIEDITREKEAEIAYAREEQYRKAVLADAIASYVVNFTTGRIESCKVDSAYCIYVDPGEFYDEVIKDTIEERFHEEDRILYLSTFSRAFVLESFQNGKTEFCLEYRSLNPDGTIIWMETMLRLVRDRVTNEIKGFMYVRNIDEKKREELELTRKSQHDPMTGAYNKGAAVARIEESLKSYIGIQSGVFMMLDVDNFKGINDTYGHPFGDDVLIKIVKILQEYFRDNDIIGRLGGDEFCVFFSGIKSMRRIEHTAEQIRERIQTILPFNQGKPGVSCSIGITCCNGKAKSFNQLYKEADISLYRVKRQGRNAYAFYEPIE